MALLKESVDTTLSFHAEMFPVLAQLLGSHIIQTSTADGTSAMYWNDRALAYFSPEDSDAIRSKIREYDANHKSRSGGAELLKCLQRIQTAKESLQKNVDTIRDILQPKVVTRTTLAAATALAEQGAIQRIAVTFKSLPEKMLRSFAESIVGDAQIEYTVEELPLLIATKQISGTVLAPGEVL